MGDNQITTDNEMSTYNEIIPDIKIEKDIVNSCMDRLYCGKRDESPHEKCVKIFGEKITDCVIFPTFLVGCLGAFFVGQVIKGVFITGCVGITTIFISSCASIGFKIGSSIVK